MEEEGQFEVSIMAKVWRDLYEMDQTVSRVRLCFVVGNGGGADDQPHKVWISEGCRRRSLRLHRAKPHGGLVCTPLVFAPNLDS